MINSFLKLQNFHSTDGDIEIDEVDPFKTVRHFQPPGGWIN